MEESRKPAPADPLEWQKVWADSMPEDYWPIATNAFLRFAEAYAEYGEESGKNETGLAGQWADLFRKIMKLKRSLWAGEKGHLTREGEREILQDMIGHALLALRMLDEGKEGGRR